MYGPLPLPLPINIVILLAVQQMIVEPRGLHEALNELPDPQMNTNDQASSEIR